MIKRIRERKLHLLVITFFLGLFLGVSMTMFATAQEPAHKYLDYFHRVYQIIATEYVDAPSSKEMFYGAIRGMIASLGDPYSRFLDEESYQELNEMTTGKFVGIGVEIASQNGDIVVITPIEESPAMQAGIKAGDVIVKVNDTTVHDKKISDIIQLIKGLPNSAVRLSVQREGFDDPIEYSIMRAPIKIKSVKFEVIPEYAIGYVKVINFGSDTPHDMAVALKSFNDKKIDRVIVDLRYNPGGLLTAAIDIAEQFLEKGQVIVSTRGREGSGVFNEFKAEKGPIYRGKLLVLVNRGSASASEILAGAIRDNKRGVLLGEKTFGKGSVQKSYNLDENIGVAITIAKYYTPSGELIHQKGITPELVVPSEVMTKQEIDAMREIEKKKLLDKFVTRDLEYTPETRERFAVYLKSQGVVLPEQSASYLLKSSILKFRQKPLFDLEFDPQLRAGIKAIKGNG